MSVKIPWMRVSGEPPFWPRFKSLARTPNSTSNFRHPCQGWAAGRLLYAVGFDPLTDGVRVPFGSVDNNATPSFCPLNGRAVGWEVTLSSQECGAIPTGDANFIYTIALGAMQAGSTPVRPSRDYTILIRATSWLASDGPRKWQIPRGRENRARPGAGFGAQRYGNMHCWK